MFFLILKRMGEEMKPRGMRPDSAKAYDTKVRYASERVLTWLNSLKDEQTRPETEAETDGSGSCAPDAADEFSARCL